MKLNLLRLVFFLAILNCEALQAQDDQQDAELTQMRQKLRDYAGQLQDAQNQIVTLQATQAQSDKDKADLQAKVDALGAQLKTVSDQAAADKADMGKQIADLQAQAADQKGQIDRLNEGLKEWKDAYNQTAQLAATSEAARKQYAMEAAILQRTVDDRETKNLALYKLGNEILTRYEKFGLGEALEAKEPFVGLSRVKLETLVQDYKNKLLDQAVTSGQTAATSLQPASAPAPGAPKPAASANAAPPAVPADPTAGTSTASARSTNSP
jgi:DNA repair exonuclease SbcCD ATPase subunit